MVKPVSAKTTYESAMQMRKQSFEYGVFLTCYKDHPDRNDPKILSKEPPPISEGAFQILLRQIDAVLVNAEIPYRRYDQYKSEFGKFETKFEKELFGPSPERLIWEYTRIHQWLDEIIILLSSCAAQEPESESKDVKYNIHIDNVVGPVNVLSSLDHVEQVASQAPSLSKNQRQDLLGLIEDLKQAITIVPDTHHEEAEAIVEQTNNLAKELERPKPRKTFLRVTAQGLIEAAKTLEGVVPSVFKVTSSIVEFINRIIV